MREYEAKNLWFIIYHVKASNFGKGSYLFHDEQIRHASEETKSGTDIS